MSTKSDEDRIADLYLKIEAEQKKPESERNFDLVKECFDEIANLIPEDEKETQEVLEARLKIIKARAGATKKSKAKDLPKRRSWRAAVAIAAVLAVLFASLSVVAAVGGYCNAFDFISENVQKILGMDRGEKYNDGSVTIIKGGKTIKYNSIEELWIGEQLEFMYPSKLPKGVSIDKVTWVDMCDGMYAVIINLSTGEEINIKNFHNIDYSSTNFIDDYTTKSGQTYFFCEWDMSSYQVVCHYKNAEYMMSSNNYNDLILIIENMKEISK